MSEKLFCLQCPPIKPEKEKEMWDIVVSGDGNFSLSQFIEAEVAYSGMCHLSEDELREIWQNIEAINLGSDIFTDSSDSPLTSVLHFNLKLDSETDRYISRENASEYTEITVLLNLISKLIKQNFKN